MPEEGGCGRIEQITRPRRARIHKESEFLMKILHVMASPQSNDESVSKKMALEFFSALMENHAQAKMVMQSVLFNMMSEVI